jgi:hypothetical protein
MMPLTRIDRVDGVNEQQTAQQVVKDLCKVLFETQKKLMDVKNECVELRRELEDVKRRMT